ncbi:unnamed protein product [Rhizoctonia solani]|uniref:Uncharacterized protein n=1 Tax=Rhizoctonia solani TaxID=456999 RepID=A0A8H3AQV8_9AGAM|nr:unnamed protein product [Rhizoctonia solani]CAE6479271.1 unnamed protein product [Rhizoctonia solani]
MMPDECLSPFPNPQFSSELEKMLFGCTGYNQFVELVTRSVDQNLAEHREYMSRITQAPQIPRPAPRTPPSHLIPQKRKSASPGTMESEQSDTARSKRPSKAQSESPTKARHSVYFLERAKSSPIQPNKSNKRKVNRL